MLREEVCLGGGANKEGDNESEADPSVPPSQQREQHADADAGGVAKAAGELVKVCDPGEGSFNVALPCGGLVDDLKVAIGESRGIANARRAISIFVAGEDDVLEGTRVVEACMTEAGVNELFMLQKVCSDRDFLMDLFSANDGADWSDKHKENWGSDAALCDWAGVGADADGNVRSINSRSNRKITGHMAAVWRVRTLLYI
jgi:hypothetical protein